MRYEKDYVENDMESKKKYYWNIYRTNIHYTHLNVLYGISIYFVGEVFSSGIIKYK